MPKPSEEALRRQLNAIKGDAFPWMLEVTKNAPQMAVIHLGQAFKNFCAGTAQYPTFKKKGRHDSFTLTNDQFAIKGRRVRIPKLGWVRMRETVRFVGKVLGGTISRIADRWFLSVAVEIPDPPVVRRENQAVVGVDLSQNMRKTQRRLARLHARIANIRADALHQLTTDLVHRFDVIAIEDLNVAGMLKDHKLARAIADMGFGEFRRQLKYKATQRGKTMVEVSRWYPSSKTCSVCGHKVPKCP